MVRFIVSVDGNTEEASVIKSVHPLLDAEAIRVVSTVSEWKAGTQEGKPVNVYSFVSVTFCLP
jgi:protein TonB